MEYAGSLKFDTKIDSKGFSEGLNKLGSVAKSGAKIATAAIGTVSAALTAAGGFATKVGMDFETGMSEVAAISGATGKQLDALTEKAKEMGAKTKFSAAESAEAFKYMSMAGWKTEDMLSGIEGVMNLAAASGENLGLVSDIVTDALTAFGLSAKDSGEFADVLAAASSNSNTNVAMMGETFKYVAPVAGAMKFSIQDTAAAIGLMANAGIKGTQAGTALRAIFVRLSDPPKDAAEAMEALGLTVTNADGSFKSLSEIMGTLREKFAGLTDEQKAQYASALGGQEAISGLLSIVNAAPADFDKLTAAIQNSSGASKEMADIMNDNLKGDITILKSAAEGLGIAFYETFGNELRGPVKSAIGMVDGLKAALQKSGVEGLVKELGNSFASVAAAAARAAPKMINTAVKFIEAFADGIEKYAGELAAAGASIAKSMAKGIVRLAPAVYDAGVSLLKELARAVGGDALANSIGKLADTVKTTLSNAFRAAVSAVQPLVYVMSGLMQIAAPLVPYILSVVAAIKGFAAAQAATAAIAGTISAIKTLIGSFAAAKVSVLAFTATETAATVAEYALGGAMSAKEIIIGVVTGKVKLATAAQAIYNAVVAANPIGLFVAALAALVAVIGVLYVTTKKETEAEKQSREERERMKQKTDELCGSSKELSDTIKSNQKQSKEDIRSTEGQAVAAKKLADELYALNDKEKKSVSEKAKMKTMVDKLNEIMPDLKLNFNEETGALSKNKDEVYENIAVWEKLAKQRAITNMATQAIEDRYKAQQELKKVISHREDLQKEIDNIESRGKIESFYGSEITTYSSEDYKSLEEYKNSLAEVNAQIYELYGRIQDTIGIEDEMKHGMDELSSSTLPNAKKSYANIIQEIQNVNAKAPQTLDGIRQAYKEFGVNMATDSSTYGEKFLGAWKVAVETAQPEAFNSVDAFMQYVLSLMSKEEQAELIGRGTSDAWKDGLIEQAVASQGDLSAVASQVGGEYLTQYLQAMIRNKPELSAGINALLKEAGLDALPAAAETGSETGTELVDAAQEAVKQGDIDFIGPVRQAGTEAKKEASGGGTHTAEEFLDAAGEGAKDGGTQLSDACGAVVADASSQEEAAQTGADVTANAFGDEAKNEIANQEQKVQGAVSELMNAVTTDGEGADQKAVEVGQAMQEKISEGLTGRQEELKNSVITVTKNASDGAKDSARSGAIPVGNEMAEGIRIGITEKAVTMNESLKTAVRNAIEAGRKEAEIHSPSRVTRDQIGKPLVDGIAVGILDNGGEASEAMEQVIADLELQRDLGLVGDAEYYAQMERYRDEYLAKGTKEWWDYTKQILQYRADSLTQGFDLAEAVDKKEQDRLSRSGSLTLEEEGRVLRDRAARNRVFAEEVLALEGITQEKKRELHEKYLDAAEQAESEALEVQTQIYDKQAEAFEEKLDREETLFAFRKKMNGVSFEEEQGYLKARTLKYRDFSEQVLSMEAYTQEQREKLHQEYLDKAEDAERTYLENQRGRLDLVAEQLKGILPFYQKASIKEGGIKAEYELKDGAWRNKYEAAESAFLPPDYAAMSAEIDRYTALMEQLRRRMNEAGGKLSEDFYTELSGLSVQDATQLLSMLVKQSDAQFEAFAKFQAQRNALADQGAADILGIDLAAYQSGLKAALEGNSLDLSPEGLGADMAEAEAAFEDTGKSLKEKLLEHFKNVPESFLDIGVDAAESFADGFAQKLEAVKLQIQSVVAGIMPTAAAGAGAGNVQNISNAVSYNLYGSGETVAQQLQSARAHRQIEKLRGNL